MISYYVEMRKVGAGRGQVTAYPRQLESLIRLSEAHARYSATRNTIYWEMKLLKLQSLKHNLIVSRMRFSNLVELEDVEEAARLHREALKQSATDPLTGRVRKRK